MKINDFYFMIWENNSMKNINIEICIAFIRIQYFMQVTATEDAKWVTLEMKKSRLLSEKNRLLAGI